MHVEIQNTPMQTVFSTLSHFRWLDGEFRFLAGGLVVALCNRAVNLMVRDSSRASIVCSAGALKSVI